MYFGMSQNGNEPSTSNFNTKLEYKIDSESEEKSGVCRLCGSFKQSVHNIYENKGLLFDVSEKINKYLPIEVTESDNLSHDICNVCLETVLSWEQFIQQCAEADVKLRLQAETQVKLDHQVLKEEQNDQTDMPVLYSDIKHVLTEYLTMIHIDNTPHLTVVCQNDACLVKPAMNVDTFIQHIQIEHPTLDNIYEIKEFLKNQVIFEEDLPEEDSDSDVVEVPVTSETDERKAAEIPCFFCPFCEIAFSSRRRLVSHLHQHNVEVDMKVGVECCGNLYRDRADLVTHLQVEHICREPPSAHWCRTCGHIADDAAALHQHVSDQHENSTRRSDRAQRAEANGRDQKYIAAVCPECDQTFSNKYNMIIHVRNCHGPEKQQHKCDECGKTFSTLGNLRYHASRAHGRARGERVTPVCPHCGETFPTRAQRDAHALLHTGERPHACRICGKAYRTRHTLARHVEGHCDERRYACDKCPRAFRKRSHLSVHVTAAHAAVTSPSVAGGRLASTTTTFRPTTTRSLPPSTGASSQRW